MRPAIATVLVEAFSCGCTKALVIQICVACFCQSTTLLKTSHVLVCHHSSYHKDQLSVSILYRKYTLASKAIIGDTLLLSATSVCEKQFPQIHNPHSALPSPCQPLSPLSHSACSLIAFMTIHKD
jgi:hypothetical protein